MTRDDTIEQCARLADVYAKGSTKDTDAKSVCVDLAVRIRALKSIPASDPPRGSEAQLGWINVYENPPGATTIPCSCIWPTRESADKNRHKEHFKMCIPIYAAALASPQAVEGGGSPPFFLPLTVKPLDDPKFDRGENIIMDADTGHIAVVSNRNFAEWAVRAINAFATPPFQPVHTAVTEPMVEAFISAIPDKIMTHAHVRIALRAALSAAAQQKGGDADEPARATKNNRPSDTTAGAISDSLIDDALKVFGDNYEIEKIDFRSGMEIFSTKRDAMRAVLELARAALAAPAQEWPPVYVFDPDNWESTNNWEDRYLLIDFADQRPGNILEFSAFPEPSSCFAAVVVLAVDAESDPEDTEWQWFQTRAEAEAATAKRPSPPAKEQE